MDSLSYNVSAGVLHCMNNINDESWFLNPVDTHVKSLAIEYHIMHQLNHKNLSDPILVVCLDEDERSIMIHRIFDTLTNKYYNNSIIICNGGSGLLNIETRGVFPRNILVQFLLADALDGPTGIQHNKSKVLVTTTHASESSVQFSVMVKEIMYVLTTSNPDDVIGVPESWICR